MSKNRIKLGDEIEDVTSKTSGIAVGRTEWLSGQVDWVVQPYTTDDNEMLRTVTVPDAYAVKVGPGVHPEPKPPMGFHAREVGRDGGKK